MMRIISYLLVLCGISIALYPHASEWYSNYEQEALLQQLETEPTLVEDYTTLNQALETLSITPIHEVTRHRDSQSTSEASPQDSQASDTAAQQAQAPQKKASNTTLLGTIQIPKIKLKLPIVEGTTEAELRIAAGHLKGTADIGELGNTAIAAHRAHTYGRFFNRLDEVQIGDELTITSRQGKTYTYTVFDIKIVEPNDVSVLKGSKKESIVTLITCHPLYEATERLIVHAKLNN